MSGTYQDKNMTRQWNLIYKAYEWPVQGKAFSVFPNGWVIKSRTQALWVPLAGLST